MHMDDTANERSFDNITHGFNHIYNTIKILMSYSRFYT